MAVLPEEQEAPLALAALVVVVVVIINNRMMRRQRELVDYLVGRLADLDFCVGLVG
jgi:hypothetical protein